MVKRMMLMLILVGVVLGGIFGFQAFKATMIKQALASLAVPTQTVSTIEATDQDWQAQIEAVRSLRAMKGAHLSLEVAGIVDAVALQSRGQATARAPLPRARAPGDSAQLPLPPA